MSRSTSPDPATFPPGKEPTEPTEQEPGWVPEPVQTFWIREKSFAFVRNQATVPAISLVTVVTELCWLSL